MVFYLSIFFVLGAWSYTSIVTIFTGGRYQHSSLVRLLSSIALLLVLSGVVGLVLVFFLGPIFSLRVFHMALFGVIGATYLVIAIILSRVRIEDRGRVVFAAIVSALGAIILLGITWVLYGLMEPY